MRLSRSVPVLAAALALTVSASELEAQGTPHGKSQVLSIQPFNALLTIYSAEFERALSPTWTLGIGGTRWDTDEEDGDFSYTSGDLKLRYYPSGRALQGFSIGASVGLTRVADEDPDGSEASTSGPTIGTQIEYSWLLNAQRSFYVAVGGGVKALFIDEDDVEDDVNDDFNPRYPTFRFAIGWAF